MYIMIKNTFNPIKAKHLTTVYNYNDYNCNFVDPTGSLIKDFNFSNPITVEIMPVLIRTTMPSQLHRATVSIPIDDDIVENTETFMVTLSSSDSGVSVSTPSNATINIEDNDSEWKRANHCPLRIM